MRIRLESATFTLRKKSDKKREGHEVFTRADKVLRLRCALGSEACLCRSCRNFSAACSAAQQVVREPKSGLLEAHKRRSVQLQRNLLPVQQVFELISSFPISRK